MQNDQKAPAARRIDLSNSKLLSTYGRDLAAAAATNLQTKVGQLVKPGVLVKEGVLTKFGLIKTGLTKIGLTKPTSR
jgi:hypothetical protein